MERDAELDPVHEYAWCRESVTICLYAATLTVTQGKYLSESWQLLSSCEAPNAPNACPLSDSTLCGQRRGPQACFSTLNTATREKSGLASARAVPLAHWLGYDLSAPHLHRHECFAVK